jgi:putative membrane protein
VIFYVGKIIEVIAKNAVQSFAPLVAFLFAYQGDLMGKLIFGGGAFVTIIGISAILRYWFFRYRIDEDSIQIREGVIRKSQLDIKFDRIQAINTRQNLVFRAFDLVTVNFDTAGSARQEGSLPAIKTALADSLKERIRRNLPGENVEPDGHDGGPEAPVAQVRTILRLGAAGMVRIGLSSNRALIFLAFLGPVFERMMRDVEETIDENAVALAIGVDPIGLSDGIGLGFAIVFGILALLMAASIVGAFLRYHNFALVADKDVLRSTGGLLTRHEHSVNFTKIQSAIATQNPVMRLFGRLRLGAKQASSGKPGADKVFVVPLVEPGQLPRITNEIFGDEFPDADLYPRSSEYQGISPYYVRSRMILSGILPALALTGFASQQAGIAALAFLLWIPLNGLLVWTIYRKYGYRIAAEGMMLRRGFLGYRVTAFTHRKVQRVSVTQTIPQKRKGLATLRVYLASGSLKLPYIDFEMAKQLRDYMLYKVESSQLAWH